MSDNKELEYADKVEEVRAKLGPILADSPLNTDFNLNRWLRGLDGDVQKVTKQLEEHLILRRLFHLDAVLQHGVAGIPDSPEKEVMERGIPNIFRGQGSRTRNVVYCINPFGLVDAHIAKCFNNVDCIRSFLLMGDVVQRHKFQFEAQTGKETAYEMIIDAANLSVAQMRLYDFLSLILHHAVKNYVEIVDKVYIVNVFPAFRVIIGLVLQFLPSRTAEKVVLLADPRDVAKHLDPEFLPKCYGGHLNNEDVIPTKDAYAMRKTDYYKASEDPYAQLERATFHLGAGQTGWAPGYRIEDGQELMLIIDGVQGRKFGFAVYLASDENEEEWRRMEPVYPHLDIVLGSEVPIRVHVKDTAAGWLRLFLSNTHSWLRGLTLHYGYYKPLP